MKTEVLVSVFASLSAVAGRPVSSKLFKREVPQEHGHQQFLTTVAASLAVNNPAQIKDPVFGLLGNAAAAQGAGSITDTECLQQATADQAFTNAKAANDVAGMTAALIYRALERNTGSVGLQSNSCTSIQATNPEIAAVSQHQDPASDGAAATNKAIVLALAKQIASVGGDPQDALKSGTFAPGQIGDPTAKGNTCDDPNDAQGCIFTQNLIQDDATADEIAAAAGGAGAAGADAGTGADAGSAASDNSTATAAPPAAAASNSSSDSSSCGAAPAAGASNATAAASSADSTASADDSSADNSTSTAASGAALDLGSATCADPAIAFGVGFDGRKEASFQPDDTATFQHGSALNPGIVANFICDRLNDQCQAPDATVSACRTAASAINGQNGDPAAADQFNSALGVTASKTGVDAGSAAAGAAAGADAGADANAAGGDAGADTSTGSTGSSSSSTGSAALGSCADASITFGPASDRGGADAFTPTDATDFNHGSALNIKVISGFICQQLQDKCKAGAAAVDACNQGAAASQDLTGQAAADAFNKAVAGA